MLFKEAIDEFINYLTIEVQRSPYTIDAYKKDLKYLLRYLSKTNDSIVLLKDIDTSTLRKYLTYAKQEKSYSSRTMMRNIATLKSFFNFAHLEGLLESNPAKRLKSPKIPEEIPRFLVPEEIERICASVDRDTPEGLRNYTMIITLYYAGLRVSEMVNLQLSDLHEYQDLSVRKGKGGKSRLVPIHRNLKQNLQEYLEKRHSTSSYLFPNKQGQPLTTQFVRKMVKKYAIKAGIEPNRVTPHVFRHSFATFLYKNGHVDLLRISKLLGHANLRATTIYTHTTVDHLRDAIEKL
ncbi:site-specific tyrosine recombinase/integron integrase [Desulfotomaculum sp. 1211_IL3151]|uniref:site-specific tyrosine recombinase/integron integrase n=1 Tax=Desulfotomaculum sp. 1211_IL3151 TaxID=3084055 RepID=UPI002FD8A05C